MTKNKKVFVLWETRRNKAKIAGVFTTFKKLQQESAKAKFDLLSKFSCEEFELDSAIGWEDETL